MLIIICISLVGLIIMLIELRRAPEAHENRSGFHLLPHKPSRDRMAGLEQSGQRSIASDERTRTLDRTESRDTTPRNPKLTADQSKTTVSP